MTRRKGYVRERAVSLIHGNFPHRLRRALTTRSIIMALLLSIALILPTVLLLLARRPRPALLLSLNCPDRRSSRTFETMVVITDFIRMLKWVLVDSLVLRHVSDVTRNDIAKLTL